MKSKDQFLFLFLLITFTSLKDSLVSCFEYQVGGKSSNYNWSIPPANDSEIYNEWASQNRFRVGDTLLFKYKKDSVMEVNEEDYKNCNSSHPKFFSNTGNTVHKLDNERPFYFISGVYGHCQKGLRMIVKAVSTEDLHDNSSGSRGPVLSIIGVFNVVLFHIILFYGTCYV